MREMMNCYDVNIRVPSQEAKSDLVIISGVPSNVEAAKVRNCANTQPSMRSSIFEPFCTTAYFQVGLAEKLTELEAEKEEKIRNSFVVRNNLMN